MFTNVESTELIISVENIMVELKKRLDPSYVEAKKNAEVDGDNVIQHKGLKLKKVEREAHEGDYVKFLDSRSFSTHNSVIYGPAMKFEAEGELVVTCIDNVEVLIYKDVYNRTTSTVEVFEPIGHCKPVEYEPPFTEVITPNEQRSLLIKQAKEFVEGLFNTHWKYKNEKVINKDSHLYSCEFVINREKRTVVSLLRLFGRTKTLYKGIAKCAPDDVFNEHIGQAIALARALEIEVPEVFLKAVQPDEIVVGQVVQCFDYESSPLKESKILKVGDGNYFTGTNDIHCRFEHIKTGDYIIEDTNAEYNNA